MEKLIKPIGTEDRACDICSSNDLEETWKYEYKSETRNFTFLWNVRNVVCRKCGFAFVAPVPTEDSLKEYYADTYLNYEGQNIDFSIDNRLHIVNRHSTKRTKRYIEIGSNYCPEFTESISKRFEVTTVELNEGCESTNRSLTELPEVSGDLLAGYFVLEHIHRPKEFLELCYSVLRDNGTMILEVPNLYLYPKNSSGLFWHEHINHFSPLSLARLAKSAGFRLVEISDRYCSRPFGFVAVFRKDGVREQFKKTDRFEWIIARGCMLEGLEVIAEYNDKISDIRTIIDYFGNKNEFIVVWGANDNCIRLFDNYRIPENAVIVDSNPAKERIKDIPVHRPSEVLEHIRRGNLFVISSPHYADEIKKSIEGIIEKPLTDDNSVIFDFPK